LALRRDEEHGLGTLMATAQDEIPQAGALVEVRGQRWVLSERPDPGFEGNPLLALTESWARAAEGLLEKLEHEGALARIFDHALGQGIPAVSVIQDRLVAQWPKVRDPRNRELRRVADRYQEIRRHSLLVAVMFVAPCREAVR
jgi:hypothetical protein